MGIFRDTYIVRWLLQNTESGNIIWQRRDHGALFADLNEGNNCVRVAIGTSTRPPLTSIKFTSPGLGEVSAQEPLTALFRRKYESEDDEELAKVMKHLLAAAANQHARRQLKEMENEDERKQSIYHRLLGGG